MLDDDGSLSSARSIEAGIESRNIDEHTHLPSYLPVFMSTNKWLVSLSKSLTGAARLSVGPGASERAAGF